MDINRARERDVPAILDLWGDLARHHAELDEAFAPASSWRAAYQGYLHALLDEESARILVAREREKILAFGVGRITTLPPFFKERRRGFIQDVLTRRGYRRRGIAGRLVDQLLQWFREQGIRTVELTVAVRNQEALSFWETAGFEPYMSHLKRQV